MSKNVILSEGYAGRRMPNVERILTLRPTSGSDLWVPVDERLSRQKYITKNGTFYATDEELYAFSKVTVNVTGGVQGVTTPTVTTPISNTSPDATPDIDQRTGQLNDVTIAIEALDQTTSPTAAPQAVGTSGSSIYGMDSDGKYYTVSVNSYGEIVKTPTESSQ